ncbi:hypothetical protein DMUE_5468 [Dictyocoela muelleri]|nr:hypothetical protein DMUE_5468 [Dictyocoela muelleri]
MYKFDYSDDIPPELKITINGNKFLQYDSGILDPKRILIFANSERLDYIKNSEIWLGDGTFKMAPEVFYQIYIIYIQIFKSFIPIIFGLLPDKTERSYSRLFAQISKLLGKMNLNTL